MISERISDDIPHQIKIVIQSDFVLHLQVHIKEYIIGLDKQKFQHTIVNMFLPINFEICFGCSKEPSHRDGSFEYPQHIFG